MEAVKRVSGRAVPLRRSDVDTDQIIPAVWLKRVERSGFGEGLFSAWRADEGFVLNDERYAGASILVAGPNFGVGSSREHAVWALVDYGFGAVLSPRFGDIFRNNCIRSGLVPAQVDAELGEAIMSAIERDPSLEVTLDVEALEVVVAGAGISGPFHLDPQARHRLIAGLDDIATTLAHEAEISAFEAARPAWLPSLGRR